MSEIGLVEIAAAASGDDPGARPVVTLQPRGHRRAEGGHPWIYSNEIVMDAQENIGKAMLELVDGK